MKKPFNQSDIDQLKQLSEVINQLFQKAENEKVSFDLEIFAADISEYNRLGYWNYNKLLYFACNLQAWELAEKIIRLGGEQATQFIQSCTHLMQTALHWAVFHNNEKMVKLLIDTGADVKCEKFSGEQTPIFVAVQQNNYNMVKLLAPHGIVDSIQGRNSFERSILHHAIEYCDWQIVQILLQQGVDPNKRIGRAVSFDGANISQRPQITLVPLLTAAIAGVYRKINILIDAKAIFIVSDTDNLLDLAIKEYQNYQNKHLVGNDTNKKINYLSAVNYFLLYENQGCTLKRYKKEDLLAIYTNKPKQELQQTIFKVLKEINECTPSLTKQDLLVLDNLLDEKSVIHFLITKFDEAAKNSTSNIIGYLTSIFSTSLPLFSQIQAKVKACLQQHTADLQEEFPRLHKLKAATIYASSPGMSGP